MGYTLLVNPLVWEEDFPRINRADHPRLLNTIHKKLSRDPRAFGKPLAGPLKRYWRLAVGPYRGVYRIEETKITVLVILIGFRRDEEVYRLAAKRLGLVS